MKLFNKPRNIYFYHGIKYQIVNFFNRLYHDPDHLYESENNVYVIYGDKSLLNEDMFKDKQCIVIRINQFNNEYNFDTSITVEPEPNYILHNNPDDRIVQYVLSSSVKYTQDPAIIPLGNHNEIACELLDKYFFQNNIEFELSDTIVKIRIDENKFYIDWRGTHVWDANILYDVIQKYCDYFSIKEYTLLFPNEKRINNFKNRLVFIHQNTTFDIEQKYEIA